MSFLSSDYLDLFPEDSKNPGKCLINDKIKVQDTWKAMTKLPPSKVKAVGVSNFRPKHLDAIIEATGVVPAVNQIERHPLLPDLELMDYLKSKNIHATAYSAFGNNMVGEPLLTEHPKIKEAAEAKKCTPAQVM